MLIGRRKLTHEEMFKLFFIDPMYYFKSDLYNNMTNTYLTLYV